MGDYQIIPIGQTFEYVYYRMSIISKMQYKWFTREYLVYKIAERIFKGRVP